MKKSQALGLSVIVAGSAAIALPRMASAVMVSTGVTCTAATTSSESSSCSGSGGYTQENVSFVSSKGVVVDAADSTDAFGACAYHFAGSKSFGMTTQATAMTILTSTGGTADSAAGCAGAGGGSGS